MGKHTLLSILYFRMLPLTMTGLRLPMRQIRPMRGMSISTMALTVGMVRRMRIVFGALEVDSDLIFDFFNPNHLDI